MVNKGIITSMIPNPDGEHLVDNSDAIHMLLMVAQ